MKQFCKHVLPILFCFVLLLSGLCTISASADTYYEYPTATVGQGQTSIGPEDVKYLSHGGVDKLIIAEGVTNIEPDTFSYWFLGSVQLPKSLKAIEDGAFCGSTLTSITIPDNVTTIGSFAFDNCSKLKTVKLGKNLQTIDDHAFSNCFELTEITIPNNVSTIGERAFAECTKLKTIKLGNTLQAIGPWAFSNCPELTEITIPNSVTDIGECAFIKCKKLKTVKLGDGLQTIGSSAFNKCSELTEITIPKNVTTIGDFVFGDCEKLTTIYFNACDCQNELSNPLWWGAQSNVETVVIGLEVTVIPKSAFTFLSKLETVIIPANVKTIEEHAFENCANLKTVTLEEGLERIEDWAFYGCKALTEITIPNSVTFIDDNAFALCSDDLKINIEDESLLEGSIPREGYWDELWVGLVAVFGGAAIVLIIVLIIALLASLTMNVIYLVGCIKITGIYCRKKQKSSGGLTVLAVFASLLGLGFWYLLVIAILNRGEKEKTA